MKVTKRSLFCVCMTSTCTFINLLRIMIAVRDSIALRIYWESNQMSLCPCTFVKLLYRLIKIHERMLNIYCVATRLMLQKPLFAILCGEIISENYFTP